MVAKALQQHAEAEEFKIDSLINLEWLTDMHDARESRSLAALETGLSQMLTVVRRLIHADARENALHVETRTLVRDYWPAGTEQRETAAALAG